MQVTVPGNILLAGEYIVTEEGGLGIAAAIEKRISLTVEESEHLEIHGRWGHEHLVWTADSPSDSSLYSSVVESVLESAGGNSLPNCRIIVDTSPFFLYGNKKRGFGSSAAVAAGLTYLLLKIIGGAPPDTAAVFRTALRGHRAFQNGEGSGYDIAASVFGGIGLFTGGHDPEYRSLDKELFAITLVQGEIPVSTVKAVDEYKKWKKKYPKKWESYFKQSNDCVAEMSEAETYEEAVSHFLQAKKLGLRLGEEIGIKANFKPAHPSDGQFLKTSPYKSVGAGNELAAVLIKERTIAPFSIAREGVRIE